MKEIDSRDEEGHFCGQDEKTGEWVRLDSALVGYCGPNCKHCKPYKVYAVQEGVWVCAADYDPGKDFSPAHEVDTATPVPRVIDDTPMPHEEREDPIP